jgi:sugar O-acyltransferase (sialic acid O-acetyltransferase NeuD family)
MKVAIFGVGILAELIYRDIIKNTNDTVVCFVSDEQKNNIFLGLPHVNLNYFIKNYSNENINLFVAIGPSNMNDNRLNVYNKLKKYGVNFYNYKSPFALYDGIMNDNVYIGNFSSIHESVTIGPGTLILEQVNISHDTEIKDFVYISPNSSVGSYVTIENNSILGMGSIVKPKIRIAKKSLIGAGSYISRDTKENGVYSPVKVKFYGQISNKIDISQ